MVIATDPNDENDEKPQRGEIFISMSLRWSFGFRDSITINISPRWGFDTGIVAFIQRQ